MSKKRLAATAISVVLALGCGCLFSCSSGENHQVIGKDEACTSCHADKKTYDVASPSSASQVGTTFTVSTDAEKVVLCKPIFIDEKGTKCVPQKYKEYKVNGSLVTITADAGVWAVAIDNGSSSTYKILKVSANDSVTMLKL